MSKQRPWNTALSSLVITLTNDKSDTDNVVQEIAKHAEITVDKRIGQYLPILIESTDARPIHRWLDSLPGVLNVDVVFCSTEIPDQEPPAQTMS